MMSVYAYISWNEGSLFTKWGPCLDGSKLECDCIACKNANRIEREGLDWDAEYTAARLRDFDREIPNAAIGE